MLANDCSTTPWIESTATTSITPRAIEIIVSSDATRRCVMLRRAMRNRLMRRPPRSVVEFDLVDLFQPIDPVELAGDFGRVRDHDERDLFLAARLADQIDDLLLVARVDIGRRLVGQKQAGLVGQGPGDGHPLLLADRQCRGAMASCDATGRRGRAAAIARAWSLRPRAKVIPSITFSNAEKPGSRLNV